MVFNTLAVLMGNLKLNERFEGRTGSISILIIEAAILEQIGVFRHFDCLLAHNIPGLSQTSVCILSRRCVDGSKPA